MESWIIMNKYTQIISFSFQSTLHVYLLWNTKNDFKEQYKETYHVSL